MGGRVGLVSDIWRWLRGSDKVMDGLPAVPPDPLLLEKELARERYEEARLRKENSTGALLHTLAMALRNPPRGGDWRGTG